MIFFNDDLVNSQIEDSSHETSKNEKYKIHKLSLQHSLKQTKKYTYI